MRALVDDLDRDILHCLYEDGRMPCAEIARRLGHVSVRTVSNRIRRLTGKGIINIRPVVLPKAIGYGISADVSVEVAPGKAKDVANRLLSLGRVSYIAIVTGDRDLDLAVYAVDVEDLQRFIQEELHSIPGVARTRTYVIAETTMRTAEWRMPAELP
jgi:Lrp/AsnC family transcriptional regulator for asnA, asnC and gidA